MQIAMAVVRMVSANPKLIKAPGFEALKTLVVQYDGKPGKRKVQVIDQRTSKKASGAACAASTVIVPLTQNLSALDASHRHEDVEYVYDIVDHPEVGAKLNCQADTAPARYAKYALPLSCRVEKHGAPALASYTRWMCRFMLGDGAHVVIATMEIGMVPTAAGETKGSTRLVLGTRIRVRSLVLHAMSAARQSSTHVLCRMVVCAFDVIGAVPESAASDLHPILKFPYSKAMEESRLLLQNNGAEERCVKCAPSDAEVGVRDNEETLRLRGGAGPGGGGGGRMFCNGGRCSMHGIAFSQCVTRLHPLPHLTALVACHFWEHGWCTTEADIPIQDTTARRRHIRNALYWMYATTVYGMFGGGNRMTMPRCLEYYIRSNYPNAAVDAYSYGGTAF